MRSRSRPTMAIVIWLTLACAAGMLVARARYVADLSAFLPSAPSAAQRLLVDQLRDGLASRLILIGIEGGTPANRSALSRSLGTRLRASGRFVSVGNGAPASLDRDRDFLFEHRYLLSPAVTPERFTSDGLHAALQQSLDLLASPAGLLVKALLTRDPTGELVQILEELGDHAEPRSLDGAWTSRDGRRALLVAQTRAAGSDLDGQEQAVAVIRQAFSLSAQEASTATTSAAGGSRPRLLLSGPGVFAVAARSTIEREVVRLSILSSVLIVGLLLLVYRSLPTLLRGLVPVASGALAGVAAVSVGFGVVHGITLGFGVTLIGEAVDYSIYLFIQARGAGAVDEWKRTFWPTVRLGVLTSIAGFACLLPSGFPGLEQLGLYSIAGLVAAAAVTRFVLPALLPARFVVRDVAPLGRRAARILSSLARARAFLFIVPLIAAGVLYSHRGALWSRELSSLSPVSAADQALDAMLRGDLGAPDARYLVVVSGADRQSVLTTTEVVDRQLDALTEAGAIGGYDSPARFLPSEATQRTRQASLPDAPELRRRLTQALSGLPLSISRLEPFLHDVESAKAQPLLLPRDLAGSSFESAVEALLIPDGRAWDALLPLFAPPGFEIDVQRVHSALSAAAPGKASVLDVKGEADRLYSTYLAEVLRLSVIGLVAIVILLTAALRSARRSLAVVVPLVLAVLSVAATLVALGRTLTILHVIGMLLIVAVGSNYALFFDHSRNRDDDDTFGSTLASLVIANAATVTGFGVLATSSVPVLSALGQTVAPGALLALVFSGMLVRRWGGTQPRMA